MQEVRLDAAQVVRCSDDDVLVSIIIPVFNTPEKLLRRCLRSVLNQSHRMIEVIVVDDGSSDTCVDIISEFAEQDHRVKLLQSPHRGVSHARNIGMESAEGEWIAFVDADDTVAERFAEEALAVAADSGADFVCGGRELVHTNSTPNYDADTIGYWFSSGSEEKNILQKQMLAPYKAKALVGPDFKGRGPVAKLYRVRCLKDIHFNQNLRIGEDVFFNYEYIGRCSSVVIVDRCWYLYFQYDFSSAHHFSYAATHQSLQSMWDSMVDTHDSDACCARIVELLVEAIDSSTREFGAAKGFRHFKALFMDADKRQVFSRMTFKPFEVSLWVRVLAVFCRHKLFLVAYMFWALKYRVKTIIRGREMLHITE